MTEMCAAPCLLIDLLQLSATVVGCYLAAPFVMNILEIVDEIEQR